MEILLTIEFNWKNNLEYALCWLQHTITIIRKQNVQKKQRRTEKNINKMADGLIHNFMRKRKIRSRYLI